MDAITVPTGLSRRGRSAAIIIKRVLAGHGITEGDGKLFYSSKEWQARGEEYGLGSDLVLVYDGHPAATFFRMGDHMRFYEEMVTALRPLGYAEECTCWYAAFYGESNR